MIVEINDSFIETDSIINIDPIYTQHDVVCIMVGFKIYLKDKIIHIRETVMKINSDDLDSVIEQLNNRRCELIKRWSGGKEIDKI